MILLLLATWLCVSSAQLIDAIDGIRLFGTDGTTGLRDPLPGTAAPATLSVPTAVPALPLSMRTIYKPRGALIPGNPPETQVLEGNRNLLIITGSNLVGMGNNALRLIPYSSSDCNTNPAPVGSITGIVRDPSTVGGAQRAAYTLPGTTGGIDILESEGMWICVSPRGDNNYIHTNLLVMEVAPCDADATNSSSTAATIAVSATSFPTNCVQQAALDPLTNAATTPAGLVETGFNDPRYRERTRRTVCCGWRDSITIDNVVLPKRFGLCINPEISQCCDSRSDSRQRSNPAQSQANIGGIGKPFSMFREKCCFGGDEFNNARDADRGPGTPVIIKRLDQPCPCALDDVERWCGPNNLCCTANKYPELLPRNTSGAPDLQFINGKCYDPNIHKCCNTGEIYDPGTHQCCSINGLQSVNVACPCGVNTDCAAFQTCCAQQFPAPIPNNAQCTPYLNYPSGQGLPRAQPCPGQCIDTRFQMCCNGVACMDGYETCCNSTCCNRFNEYCTVGFREGAPNQPFNPRNFRIPFETCTKKEALTPPRAVTAYFLPLILLLATYLGLAATLFFAKRINTFNPISSYERMVYILAILAVLFAWPLFFSSLYKYGLVVAFGAFICILAALSGIRPLMVVAIFVQLIVLLYLIDPFYGNELFTFAYHRANRPDAVGFNGVLHSIRQLWEDPVAMSDDSGIAALDTFPFTHPSVDDDGEVDDDTNPGNDAFFVPDEDDGFGFRCSDFYFGFFDRDEIMEDNLRYQNPEKYRFGLCSRDWLTALLVLSAILIIISILLFVAVVVAAVKNILVQKAVNLAPIPYY